MSPIVSVILAAHDAESYVGLAVDSVLRQTVTDLELIVIDDCSRDSTPDLLRSVGDDRVVVARNDAQLGLAASLNRGLDLARGRWVARLDADDAMLPGRLEAQLARVARSPRAAILGTGVLEIDAAGRPGRVHEPPVGPAAVRWQLLFGAPFFHPTVLVDRELLDTHGLRYDTGFGESEDYELWSRVLALADGDNLRAPLVLRRLHTGQASRRRRDLQRGLQQQVALREIGRLAPELEGGAAELAWKAGAGLPVADAAAAGEAFGVLLERFEREHGRHREVRVAAGRSLARIGCHRQALDLDRLLPFRVAAGRRRRRAVSRETRPVADTMLRRPGAPVRVTVVSPEPTPYRSPLFDRIAESGDVELTVVYAGRTVARRTWVVEPRHRSVFLKGVSLPGASRIVHHDYPVTPGIWRELAREQPEVVVVSGWSTFAAQTALLWARIRRVPYVLLVVSHDAGPRAGWRAAVKRAVVPRLLGGAAGVLVVGTLARRSALSRGARADRIGVFANTVDVDAFAARASELSPRRGDLRHALGLVADDVAVLSVGRLAREKRHDDLLRAVAHTGDSRLVAVLAGAGPERDRLERLASELGTRVVLTGDLPWERVLETYVAADVFALLSDRETWGVVVNEAAACGLPLVLSDQVGAAADLLRDGENGALVPVGDVAAAAAALVRLAGDPSERAAAGRRSRELVAGWGYDASVAAFVKTVRAAALR